MRPKKMWRPGRSLARSGFGSGEGHPRLRRLETRGGSGGGGWSSWGGEVNGRGSAFGINESAEWRRFLFSLSLSLSSSSSFSFFFFSLVGFAFSAVAAGGGSGVGRGFNEEQRKKIAPKEEGKEWMQKETTNVKRKKNTEKVNDLGSVNRVNVGGWV